MTSFITRIHKYSAKHLQNGVCRIYIQNAELLRSCGFAANTPYVVHNSKHNIQIEAIADGDREVVNTSRGELLELRNKETGRALKGLSQVTITFRKGRIVITITKEDADRLSRENQLLSKLHSNQALSVGSLFSGLGMLTLNISNGMKSAGIRSRVKCAIDKSELALSCQLESNPLWCNPDNDACAIVDDLSTMDLDLLPTVDYLEIGYPCVGQSTLSPKNRRDTLHPDVGTLFVATISAIRKLNPAVVVIENAVPFLKSDTLRYIERELTGYNIDQTVISGHRHGDFEERKRACIVATSKGLPLIQLSEFKEPANPRRTQLNSILEPVSVDSSAWSTMKHVVAKLFDRRLNFKHNTYVGTETKIAALSATYSSPKIGSPVISHPYLELYRPFSVLEHGRLRNLPTALLNTILDVETGMHGLVSKRGSKTAAHRMLGNGVSPKAWFNFGSFLGNYFKSLTVRELHKCIT